MNRSTSRLIVPVAVPALFVLCLSMFCAENGLTIPALPFTLLGNGLRQLSLAGTIGNIAATTLYVLIALLPVLCKLGRKWHKEDCLLPLCSALLLYVLYFMVNPTLRPTILQNSVGDLILSGVIYSSLLGWAIIKLILHCGNMSSAGLLCTLRRFLIVCAALFLCALIIGFGNCQTEIRAIAAANTTPGLDLTATYVFIYLAYTANAIEYLLSVALLLLAAKLVQEWENDAYSQRCTLAAHRTALWSRRSLIMVTLTNITLQIAQVLFAAHVHHIAVNFRLPVIGIVISFSLLALSRLLCQARELKDDNDLFI